jgi:hypothetical protein
MNFLEVSFTGPDPFPRMDLSFVATLHHEGHQEILLSNGERINYNKATK